jgi:dynein heavy chain
MMKTVEEWGGVQARWLHLLPVFSSENIVSQMPVEGKLFRVIIIWILKFYLVYAAFLDMLNKI